MSRRDWEEGSIKLPTASWPKFKKELRKGFNSQQALLFAYALKLNLALVRAGEDKPKFDYADCLSKIMHWGQNDAPVPYPSDWKPDEEQILRIRSVLMEWVTAKPHKPMAEYFPNVASDALDFAAGISGKICISSTEPKIHWAGLKMFPNGLHTQRSNMARLFFELLSKVEWTPDTGGLIYEEAYYNQENLDPSTVANYVTKRFGPLGQAT